MDTNLIINSVNKLCIICCHPFSGKTLKQNEVKISKFCEETCKVFEEGEGTLDAGGFDYQKDVIQLENRFGMSVCPSCLTVVNELLTSKENVNLLENHVLFLQQQIIQGLRDLDDCLKVVKCHQEKIKDKVKASDGLCLKNKFINYLSDGKAEESKNFVFKVRQCIRKGRASDQIMEKGLKGNLSIPDNEEPENEIPVTERILIKVEQDEGVQELLDGDLVTSGQSCDGDDSDHDHSFTVKSVKTEPRRLKSKRIPPKKKIVKMSKKWKPNNLSSAKDGKGYACKLCDGKIYTNRLSYKKHLNWHSGERKYKCEYCSKSFFRGDYLKDHLRIHTGERPFICDSCGKGFTQLAALKKHKRNVHNL